MKKIFLLLLALLSVSLLLSSCGTTPNGPATIKPNVSAPNPNTSGQKETVVPYGDVHSYERIRRDVDTYFRMFYANNQHYKWKYISATELYMPYCYITGYFDKDSLVKMTVDTGGGEGSYGFTVYYFINENLTYVNETIFTLFPFTAIGEENHKEYFIINEKLWQYDNKTGGLVEFSNEYEINYLKNWKHDILGNKPQSFIKNTFSFPAGDNLFNQFNNAKNEYFEKFFVNEKTYKRKDFNIDVPLYRLPETVNEDTFFSGSEMPENLPDENNAGAFFDNSDLRKISIVTSDETSYTRYEYYLIDDAHIYVVAYYQEFENREIKFNDMKKNYYGEYFIVNGKVMVYDTQKKDLVDSPGNADVFKYFNMAKEGIKNLNNLP